MATNRGDNETEDKRLDESDDEIAELKRVDRACPELSGGHVKCE